MDIGNNILKLEGYGVYVTYIDGKVFTSRIINGGYPKLDPDGCIEWDELTDPDNQDFLNIINARWKIGLSMPNFGKTMSIKDIKNYQKVQDKIDKCQNSNIKQ